MSFLSMIFFSFRNMSISLSLSLSLTHTHTHTHTHTSTQLSCPLLEWEYLPVANFSSLDLTFRQVLKSSGHYQPALKLDFKSLTLFCSLDFVSGDHKIYYLELRI
ncbi:hypothetical protein CHS0354_002748 [Potamilus streckersoni]|uniref:Uncharacterized protein n=1 Tax=Potamilus streckersoni TaxID=2493646 RepID=A0AAE0SK56_9BIVA|nr:hypothetical protein CHS0354_002748 [Potamilus streckersoni]